MPLFICPGIHAPGDTQAFLQALPAQLTTKGQVLPTQILPVCPVSVLNAWVSLGGGPDAEPLTIIAFSAGVVGAAGAAWMWQLMGGQIDHFFALDGWGVPIIGNFPLHRLSHDKFTHWSSQPLGRSSVNFYADPPVSHLHLWRYPDQVVGWRIEQADWAEMRSQTTAAAFLAAEMENSRLKKQR